MRALVTELSIDNWQWKLEDSKLGLIAFGHDQNRVDVRQSVFEAILQGWAMWPDEIRESVMDFLVRDHFEYWGRDGNHVSD